jgi:hypothetical protein
MKLERNLDGRNRWKTTAKKLHRFIAFLPADAPTVLRPGMDDPSRVQRTRQASPRFTNNENRSISRLNLVFPWFVVFGVQ